MTGGEHFKLYALAAFQCDMCESAWVELTQIDAVRRRIHLHAVCSNCRIKGASGPIDRRRPRLIGVAPVWQ